MSQRELEGSAAVTGGTSDGITSGTISAGRNSEPALISIIVPLYNCERYIEECVSSILMQSFANWELVIVNDGSTDGSLAVCERLAACYPERHIRILSQENAGHSAARRAGIQAATGTLVMPLDSDDYLMDEHALRKVADAYRESNFDICLYDAYREKWNSPCIGLRWTTGPLAAQEARDTLCSVHTAAGKMDIGYIFKVVRTSLFRQTTNPNLELFEDRILAFQLFDMAERFYVINECLYFYRDTPGSISNQGITEQRLDCQLQVMALTDRYADKWRISDEARTYMGAFRRTTLYDYVKEACMQEGPIKALRMLREHEAYGGLNADDPFISRGRAVVLQLFHARHYAATYALMRAILARVGAVSWLHSATRSRA